MDTPKISAIVPIYKVEKYLVQCLDSIKNQTLENIEIILVDEGDQDACRYIIDHYEQTDNRFKAIHEKNGGYGASVNKGLAIAQGEYIAIIESDDFIDKHMFEEMYNYAKSLNADLVKTPYYEFFDKTKNDPERISICPYADNVTSSCPSNKTFSILEYPYQMSVHASLWSGIYKRSWMIEKNIKFKEGKGAGYVDVGYRIDTFLNTDRAAWLNKPFYYYRMTNSESSTNTFSLTPMLHRWYEAHLDFTSKYKGKYDKVGKYLILDEYLNTYGYIGIIPFTEDQYNLLKINSDFIPDYIYLNSPMLTNSMKERIKTFKQLKSYNDFDDYQKKFFPVSIPPLLRPKNISFERVIRLFGLPVCALRYDGQFYRIALFNKFRLFKFKS